MKKLICLYSILFGCTALAQIAPVWHTVSGRRSWNYSYDIAFDEGKIKVYVGYELNWDADLIPSVALVKGWETGIESVWSTTRFEVPIEFDINFYDDTPHATIRVRQGPARSNRVTWDTEDQPYVAIHEFGHQIGLYDEYAGGTQIPDPTLRAERVGTGGVMHYPPGGTKDYYYDDIMNWYNTTVVPEPSSAILLAASSILLLGRRRRT